MIVQEPDARDPVGPLRQAQPPQPLARPGAPATGLVRRLPLPESQVGVPPVRLSREAVLGKRRQVVLALVAVLAAGLVPAAGADSAYRVIVHPSVKGNQIPRATLSSIFLKQAPRWGDGTPVLPVDQSMRSSVRQQFAAEVLQRQMMELQIFWSRRMATGVAPPPVKQTDEEIVAFVAATPGSIGYVSAAAALPGTVRPIAVIE